MAIEACSSYSEAQTYASNIDDAPIETRWNGHLVDLAALSIAPLFQLHPMSTSEHIAHCIRLLRGSAGGSVEAKANTEGESSVVGEVHISTKDDQGNKVSVTAEGSITSNGSGNIQAEGGIKVSVEHEF